MPGAENGGPSSYEPGPAGDVYDWYVRGLELLGTGNPEAALQLLVRVRAASPESANAAEAVARALFDAGRHEEAAREFSTILEQWPDDDYARFGLGLALWRNGELASAATHLSMAAAMRPGRREYLRARDQVRATLRAREDTPGATPARDGGDA